jgi:hypothetical protein
MNILFEIYCWIIIPNAVVKKILFYLNRKVIAGQADRREAV